MPNNALDKMFTILAKQLQEKPERSRYSEVSNWIDEALSSGTNRMRWPEDAEFRAALASTNLYDKDVCTFLLHKLEKSSGTREPADLSLTTIEHVMPQVLTEQWKGAIGNDWETVHSKYCHTLGNLTLTAYNANLAQKQFAEKKGILCESGLWMNRDISMNENWGEREIAMRSERLADVSVATWTHPSFALSVNSPASTLTI